MQVLIKGAVLQLEQTDITCYNENNWLTDYMQCLHNV